MDISEHETCAQSPDLQNTDFEECGRAGTFLVGPGIPSMMSPETRNEGWGQRPGTGTWSWEGLHAEVTWLATGPSCARTT